MSRSGGYSASCALRCRCCQPAGPPQSRSITASTSATVVRSLLKATIAWLPSPRPIVSSTITLAAKIAVFFSTRRSGDPFANWSQNAGEFSSPSLRSIGGMPEAPTGSTLTSTVRLLESPLPPVPQTLLSLLASRPAFGVRASRREQRAFFMAHLAMQARVSRFLLPAEVQCLHDNCVIVIVNQRDTGGIGAHWHDCNSKGCSGG